MARLAIPTPEIEQQIVTFIRAGGFPEVAAEAAGISQQIFARWMERGSKPGARDPYKSFVARIQQAHAQARLKAEIETRQKVPRYWLGNGPGRETDATPGWTGPVKPTAASTAGHRELLTPELTQLLRKILDALEPFPQARAAVSNVLRQIAPKHRSATSLNRKPKKGDDGIGQATA